MSSSETDAAELLNTQWRLDEAGLPRLPVDPIEIARSMGAEVYAAAMQEGSSGALVIRDGASTIYLNGSDSRDRQRFTAAHEVGHLVQHSNAGDLDVDHVDWRDDLAGSRGGPNEVYCNQFAAALLMPADVVKHMHAEGLTPSQMALRCGVSSQAINFRLKNLNIIR